MRKVIGVATYEWYGVLVWVAVFIAVVWLSAYQYGWSASVNPLMREIVPSLISFPVGFAVSYMYERRRVHDAGRTEFLLLPARSLLIHWVLAITAAAWVIYQMSKPDDPVGSGVGLFWAMLGVALGRAIYLTNVARKD